MKRVLILYSLLLAAACVFGEGYVASSAKKIQPLKVGAYIPEAILYNADGTPVDLMSIVKKQPTVLVFYRGGWCPHCRRHLKGLQGVEKKLDGMGYRLLAVSPDSPEKLKETADKNGVTYTLLSDSSMGAAKAFGIAFQLDDATVKRYRLIDRVDLEESSGQTHHQLPVPAVFIIDKTGQIIYAHTNPDHKKRLDPSALAGTANLLTFRPQKDPENQPVTPYEAPFIP